MFAKNTCGIHLISPLNRQQLWVEGPKRYSPVFSLQCFVADGLDKDEVMTHNVFSGDFSRISFWVTSKNRLVLYEQKYDKDDGLQFSFKNLVYLDLAEQETIIGFSDFFRLGFTSLGNVLTICREGSIKVIRNAIPLAFREHIVSICHDVYCSRVMTSKGKIYKGVIGDDAAGSFRLFSTLNLNFNEDILDFASFDAFFFILTSLERIIALDEDGVVKFEHTFNLVAKERILPCYSFNGISSKMMLITSLGKIFIIDILNGSISSLASKIELDKDETIDFLRNKTHEDQAHQFKIDCVTSKNNNWKIHVSRQFDSFQVSTVSKKIIPLDINETIVAVKARYEDMVVLTSWGRLFRKEYVNERAAKSYDKSSDFIMVSWLPGATVDPRLVKVWRGALGSPGLPH